MSEHISGAGATFQQAVGVLTSAHGSQALLSPDGGEDFSAGLTVTPSTAFAALEDGQAILVDVRTHEERKAGGYPAQSIHIPWRIGPALLRNPRFTRELSSKAAPGAILFLICRSGARSLEAAAAARKAGLAEVWSVSGGCEGEASTVEGWRPLGLPWSQG